MRSCAVAYLRIPLSYTYRKFERRKISGHKINMSTKKAAHRSGRSELYKRGNWNGKKEAKRVKKKKTKKKT